MAALFTVHHLGVSQSERAVWACEELGLDYELVNYDRDPVTRLAPAEYKALHPMGTAPVLIENGRAMAESGAIVDYIVRKYGGGRLEPKPSDPSFADYVFWFHFANGSLVSTEMLGMISGMLGAAADAPAMGLIKDRGDRNWALVEARLGEAPYFAGEEFTAADIMMVFPLTTGRAFFTRDLAAFPNVRAYLQRIGQRPAYRRAMEKGDPGMTPMLT